MTKARAALAALLASLALFSGCGDAADKAPSTQPTPVAGAAPYPDPEPKTFGLGLLPGSQGSNGALTAASLRPIYGGRLATPAAAAWNSLNLASVHTYNVRLAPGGPDSSYRTLARQHYWRNYWCSLGKCGYAAYPGTSNHGAARAVDLANPGTMRPVITKIGGQVGWRWGEVAFENWHVTYYAGGFSRPNPGISTAYPVLSYNSGGLGQSRFVRRAQGQLRTIGFKLPPPSGQFGSLTRTAVTIFERQRGYKSPNGQITYSTWKALADGVARKNKGLSPYP